MSTKAEKQEPVAWWDEKIGVFNEKHFDQLKPLYTHPPNREWVGLTLEEILGTYRGPDGSDYVDYARAIERKLKEKNT